MPWLNVVLLLYAVLNVTMGLLGYINKHSIVSLIAGTVAAAIIGFCLIWVKTNPRSARITSLVVAILLLGNFTPGTLANKLYPAGIMFVCSLIVIICLGAGHMIGMKQKKAREATEKNG